MNEHFVRVRTKENNCERMNTDEFEREYQKKIKKKDVCENTEQQHQQQKQHIQVQRQDCLSQFVYSYKNKMNEREI